MIAVTLLNDHDFPRVPSLAAFQSWIKAVCNTIPEKIPESAQEICIAIVDSETSASLNETYRHKNGPTNVLSFHYDPAPGMLPISLGDLAICAEIVESESMAQQKPILAHWAHLTIHGMLHLLGYDHAKESDAIVMETLEINILKTLGFGDPYG